MTTDRINQAPKQEIRLFKLDQSDTVYDDLLAKLIDCYKYIPNEITLKWTDEEGDEIVVSSNGELPAALEERPDQPLQNYCAARKVCLPTSKYSWTDEELNPMWNEVMM